MRDMRARVYPNFLSACRRLGVLLRKTVFGLRPKTVLLRKTVFGLRPKFGTLTDDA